MDVTGGPLGEGIVLGMNRKEIIEYRTAALGFLLFPFFPVAECLFKSLQVLTYNQTSSYKGVHGRSYKDRR
jgi:hypothetical protein